MLLHRHVTESEAAEKATREQRAHANEAAAAEEREAARRAVEAAPRAPAEPENAASRNKRR
jgi:hypothetical protein